MTRQEVYTQMEEAFGLVPSMFRALPDSSLEAEWELFRRTQLAGVSASTRCGGGAGLPAPSTP